MTASAAQTCKQIWDGSKIRSYQAYFNCVAVRVGPPPPAIAWSRTSSKLARGQRFAGPAAAAADTERGTALLPPSLGPPDMDEIFPPVSEVSAMV